MKRWLTLCLCLSISAIGSAQNRDLLIGVWAYDSIAIGEIPLDIWQRLNANFNGLEISFSNDGTFESQGKKGGYKGSWRLTEGGDTLVMNTNKDVVLNNIIVLLNERTLIMKSEGVSDLFFHRKEESETEELDKSEP